MLPNCSVLIPVNLKMEITFHLSDYHQLTPMFYYLSPQNINSSNYIGGKVRELVMFLGVVAVVGAVGVVGVAGVVGAVGAVGVVQPNTGGLDLYFYMDSMDTIECWIQLNVAGVVGVVGTFSPNKFHPLPHKREYRI